MEARETSRSGEVLKGVKAQAGQKFMSFTHTHVGSADAVLFASYGLPNMKNTTYQIFMESESTGSIGDALSIDYSSKAETGFSFVGGTASEVSHILVIGEVDE